MVNLDRTVLIAVVFVFVGLALAALAAALPGQGQRIADVGLSAMVAYLLITMPPRRPRTA